MTESNINNPEFVKNQQDMEFRKSFTDDFVNLIDETHEFVSNLKKTDQQSKDTIELEMRYNEFTSKYRNSETGRIDINQIQEDFVKGDKDCLDMYTYMIKHTDKAKSQMEKAESQIIEGTPEQVTLITEKEVKKDLDTLAEFAKFDYDTFVEIEDIKTEMAEELNYGPLDIDIDDNFVTDLKVLDEFLMDEPTIKKERPKYKRDILDDLLDELENDKKQPKESDKIENDGKEKSNELFNSMTKSFGTCSGVEQVPTGAQKTPGTSMGTVRNSDVPQMIVRSN